MASRSIYRPIQAGKLRQRVTLQRLITTKDPFGQDIQSWEDEATVWAEILTIGGYEQVDANQVTAQSTHTVRFRKDPGLTVDPTMRVVHEGKVFEIVEAKDVDYRHRETRLSCREFVGMAP